MNEAKCHHCQRVFKGLYAFQSVRAHLKTCTKWRDKKKESRNEVSEPDSSLSVPESVISKSEPLKPSVPELSAASRTENFDSPNPHARVDALLAKLYKNRRFLSAYELQRVGGFRKLREQGKTIAPNDVEMLEVFEAGVDLLIERENAENPPLLTAKEMAAREAAREIEDKRRADEGWQETIEWFAKQGIHI